MDHAHSEEAIRKSVRTYIVVFASLMVLTIVTVAISYLHLSVRTAITIALIVATVKGTLVASYFMHLISEKKVIYAMLILTVVFFILLMVLPTFTEQNSTRVF